MQDGQGGNLNANHKGKDHSNGIFLHFYYFELQLNGSVVPFRTKNCDFSPALLRVDIHCVELIWGTYFSKKEEHVPSGIYVLPIIFFTYSTIIVYSCFYLNHTNAVHRRRCLTPLPCLTIIMFRQRDNLHLFHCNDFINVHCIFWQV